MMYAEDVVRLAELQTYFLCVISQETTGRPAPPTLPPPPGGSESQRKRRRWFQKNSETGDKGGASIRRTGLKRKANIFLNIVLHTFSITDQRESAGAGVSNLTGNQLEG